MDPDANLTELRGLITEYQHRSDLGLSIDDTDSDRIVELVTALDAWLTRGGCHPHAWELQK